MHEYVIGVRTDSLSIEKRQDRKSIHEAILILMHNLPQSLMLCLCTMLPDRIAVYLYNNSITAHICIPINAGRCPGRRWRRCSPVSADCHPDDVIDE